jgi:hypothetical protein
MGLNESLKHAIPGGDPVEVKDEQGRVIGFCGVYGPEDSSVTYLLKCLLKDKPEKIFSEETV